MRHPYPAVLALALVAGVASACADSATTSSPPAATHGGGMHIVAEGESPISIAALYGVSVPALLQANGVTEETPIRVGQPLVIPPASAPPAAAAPATGDANPGAASTDGAPSADDPLALAEVVPAEGAPAVSEDAVAPEPASSQFANPWLSIDGLVERARYWVDDIRAREGGIFVLAGGGLLALIVALQLVFWVLDVMRRVVPPAARALPRIGHEVALNSWYAAWWLGLAFWVPGKKIWRVVQPWAEPRGRALARLARERGTTWSKAAAGWVLDETRRAGLAVRDEAIDALEELALRRPALRPVSERVRMLAYGETVVSRSKAGGPPIEAWPPPEAELLEALEGGALTAQFLPVVEVASGRAASLEAHLRWARGDLGVVPEGRLASAIERPGYTRIQRALLRDLLQRACSLLASGEEGARTVSIGLGRAQFFDPTLFAMLRQVLTETGAPAARLDLGIEERTVLSDFAAASEVLTRLREFGVTLTLRSFGAMTAAQLRSLAVHGVTVDFWGSRRDRGASDYVAESVRMAREAGVHVTAVRAETPEELEFVRELGCDRIATSSGESGEAEPETRPDAALASVA